MRIETSTTLNLKPIKPRRYVYHVTNPKNRVSIMFDGIKTYKTLNPAYKLAFVNNAPIHQDLSHFWPLPIDIYDPSPSGRSLSLKEFKSSYDYWRIDTKIANLTWYIDPYMENELKSYGIPGNSTYFLCTDSVIPADSLDLMDFDLEQFNRYGQTRYGLHPELIYSEFNRRVVDRKTRKSNLNYLNSILNS
jgi:hypothetical protein